MKAAANSKGIRMKKSQIISMDFIMTFVIYIFALSVFFFALKNAFSYNTIDLDVSSELLFSRLDQVYNKDYDFFEGSKIDKEKLDIFLTGNYNPEELYDFVFKDFENPNLFQRIDFCIYIENRTADRRIIVRNFAAYDKQEDYPLMLAGSICGNESMRSYTNPIIRCNSNNVESIVLSKPVLFGNEIMALKVLICAKRR